jgi:hypothetical protein
MDIKQLGEYLAVLVAFVAVAGGLYKFYKYLTRDKVSISLALKRAQKTKPSDGKAPDKTLYPLLVFEVSIANDSKREISIKRCYLQLDKKLKQNKLFKGLYKHYFKFDDEDLRFEYQALQGKNLPLTLPSQFLCEVQLGNHHLLEYILLSDVRLVLIDHRRIRYSSNFVKIVPEKEVYGLETDIAKT